MVTDHGRAGSAELDLVFMSADATQHHQFILGSGRPADATFSTVLQIAFTAQSLDQLREIKQRAQAAGASNLRGLNHGNAWSLYFNDPEGNLVEVFMDTPFHVPQPHGGPLDLDMSDAEIFAITEQNVRNDPGYLPIAEYHALRAKALG